MRHTFDRRDRAALDLDGQDKAAQVRLAIDEHRASAALAKLAPMLGAGEAHVLAQNLEQRLVHGHQHLRALAVDVERQRHAFDGALELVFHYRPSITLNAVAHSQRSAATEFARVEAGGGSSG